MDPASILRKAVSLSGVGIRSYEGVPVIISYGEVMKTALTGFA